MYLSRAEDLIDYWAEEARGSRGASASGGGRPMSMRDIAAKFGGKHGG
jgi:hypothetical protein